MICLWASAASSSLSGNHGCPRCKCPLLPRRHPDLRSCCLRHLFCEGFSLIRTLVPSRNSTQSIRIHYDPTLIGPRDVMKHYRRADEGMSLAPPAPHASLSIGSKQTRQALVYFVPALALTLPVLVLAWAPVDHSNMVRGALELSHCTFRLLLLILLSARHTLTPHWSLPRLYSLSPSRSLSPVRFDHCGILVCLKWTS
jgi:hypothetical protein